MCLLDVFYKMALAAADVGPCGRAKPAAEPITVQGQEGDRRCCRRRLQLLGGSWRGSGLFEEAKGALADLELREALVGPVEPFQVGANLFGDYSTLAEAADDDPIVQ